MACSVATKTFNHSQRILAARAARGVAAKIGSSLRPGGYTLLEMTIVVAILAMIAAIAVPSITSGEHQKLALAGSAVAGALRYAREESRRTGTIHGISADLSSNRVRVFRLDEGPNPNLKIFDVYQPVSKQPYDINLGASSYRGISLTRVGGQMLGTCNDPGNIAFDSGGVVRCVEPVATRIHDAEIELGLDNLQLIVALDSYTGRVTIR